MNSFSTQMHNPSKSHRIDSPNYPRARGSSVVAYDYSKRGEGRAKREKEPYKNWDIANKFELVE